MKYSEAKEIYNLAKWLVENNQLSVKGLTLIMIENESMKAAQPLRAVDAAMPPSAEADSSLIIVHAVESDTQPRT